MIYYSMLNLTITTKQLNSQIQRADLWLPYLPDTEEIKKRWQKQTEELYKKVGLNNWDNHDGVIPHLEPDILKCEVKWALGSVTMNKASGGDEFHLSY